jgi:hypothetical protein
VIAWFPLLESVYYAAFVVCVLAVVGLVVMVVLDVVHPRVHARRQIRARRAATVGTYTRKTAR